MRGTKQGFFVLAVAFQCRHRPSDRYSMQHRYMGDIMHVRKWLIGGFAAIAGAVFTTASAWACVSGPSVTFNTATIKPGETVTANLRDFRKADPIQVRWNDLGAPVLASFENNGSGAPFAGTFTVPADAKPGNYVVIFSQSAPDGKVSQAPVRALLTVAGAGGANPVVGAPVAPVDAARPTGLVTEDTSVSAGTLALVALGVSGVGMFLAGMAALCAGRRDPTPQAAPARR